MSNDRRSARPELSPRAELAVRVWVGCGGIAVGLLTFLLGPTTYPAGDIRGQAAFWWISGAIVFAVGVAVLVSAVRKWRVLRNRSE